MFDNDKSDVATAINMIEAAEAVICGLKWRMGDQSEVEKTFALHKIETNLDAVKSDLNKLTE